MSVIPPPLRNEVKVRRLVQQGEISYVIKEPDKQEYYRFSLPQYQLIELFDGTHDLTQVVDKFNSSSEEYEYDTDAAESVFNACKDYQILKRTKHEENAALLERIKEERKKSRLQAQGSLLMMRFQLVDPNAWFDRIIDSIRFMWHPTALKIQAGFIAFALLLIVFNADRFAQDFTQVYLQTQFSGVLYIWVIALCAIALHECGHGLTCKYYGGDVHEMGFLLLCLQPCLYCNVNDAWLFENKTQKIQVALAGVWVEMLVAGIATFVWLVVDVYNPVGYVAFVLMTIGTASSLFVNLNPLLKFDGYYILTDWLEMQNLRQNAIAWFSWNLKKTLFNTDEEKPFNPSNREKRVYWIYGTAVVLYMTMMLSFLAWLGYQFFYSQFGFFAILGFIYIVYLFLKNITGNWISTMYHWVKSLLWEDKRAKVRTAILLITLVLFSSIYSPPLKLQAEGTISSNIVKVFAPANAFVANSNYNMQRQILATEDEPLLLMESPELNLEAETLVAKQKLLDAKKITAMLESDSSELAKVSIQLGLIEEQLNSIRRKQAALTVIPPEGKWSIDGLPPDMLTGRFFAEQEEVLSLVSEQVRFFDAIVDQRDVSYLSVGDRAIVKLNAVFGDVYNAEITNITALAKSSGVEQKVKVRARLLDWQPGTRLPVGIEGNSKLYGQHLPLWQHFVFKVRKFFRADLWL